MSESFEELAARVRACRICAQSARPLPHAPRPVLRAQPGARLLIAGQAPGTRVHASGLPFDDPSGDRLRAWMGVGRELFYDTARIAFLPMGLCFPGQDAAGSDLPPRRECAAAWRDPLMAALGRPQLMLVIGAYAQGWHLRREGLADLAQGGVNATLMRWRAIHAASGGRIFVLPHPSWRNTGWLKRNPWFEADLLPVLRAGVARVLG